ncbi:tectonin domain-containing protein [Kribbella sp. NPDC004536]|uniref:tectonin domain-containing protein n=1 Tax=Kribbella sp. NPDC004536 TaxID=3364106 RepID=UPI0036A5E640
MLELGSARTGAVRKALVVLLTAAVGLGGLFAPVLVSAQPAKASVLWSHGTLAAARNADGRLELFGSDSHDLVSHRRELDSSHTWSGWETVSQVQMRSVAAETNAGGRIELFGVNGGGRVFSTKQLAPNSNMWETATEMLYPGAPAQSIAVAPNGDGRLVLFITIDQGYVLRRSEISPGSDTWGAWELAGQPGQPLNIRSVAAGANADGRVELFGLDDLGRILHMSQTAANTNNWSGWSLMDGTLTSIAVARGADGRLNLFGTNSQYLVFQESQTAPNSSSWSGWVDFGQGGLLNSVSAATNSSGSVEVFGAYPGGAVYQRWQISGTWSNWTKLPGYLESSAPVYDITDSSQVSLFLQGVRTTGARVRIAPGVNLNLSGLRDILIAPAVQILGERSPAYPRGPRLFTTTSPYTLFLIGNDYDTTTADYVLVSGIRLDGGLKQPADAIGKPSSHGISIESSTNVEIKDSELYRWSGAAIRVLDGKQRMSRSAGMAWVHDNAIYRNEHPTDGAGSAGYGVVVGTGAYARIERNEFYHNTHSIAATGDPGTGYLAYQNLILAPGYHDLNGPKYGQDFDVHALKNCGGGSYNCGPAGEFFDIRWNSIVASQGELGVWLRGTPSDRMNVGNNIFTQTRAKAYSQTETGLYAFQNIFNTDYFGERGHFRCDFDRDGVYDQWTASGQTVWYLSSARADSKDPRWLYVMQTTKRAGQLTSADLASYLRDGICS